MKKKYLIPELKIIKIVTTDIILASMGEGDSIGENETPLIPFNPSI